MPSRSYCAIFAATLCLATLSGCATDDRSTTRDFSSKQHAPSGPAVQGPTDEDAPKYFTTTGSGLKYRILRKSNGRMPTRHDSVVAHYRGWTDDGKEFDSSYKRGSPTSFPLDGVVKGWTEGLQLIGEGGMIELELPGSTELGYGSRGMGDAIPPFSTIHFIVELIKVE